ncbi:hypothetical protein [uncultured Clostridium sp.]|uniref:hypothetical protein n=1 Tax=uncultured Clostridium sp. TaxID=59620 RepID=UPI0028ED2750|nr:hypothetical protein [uncultured Clostridium sp.]
MGKIIGKCALCKKEELELLQSHIIPKFTYKRLAQYPNSRFRNYYKLNDIFQDGEKKPLLCSGCEGFFSKFEVKFVNGVLDKYLNNKKNEIDKKKYDDFIFSLNWRIIYDGIFNLKSFDKTSPIHQPFYEMEELMWTYLDARRREIEHPQIDNIKNYIIFMEEFKLGEQYKEMFKSSTFGYSFSADNNSKYIVMTYFLGVICVTVYELKNVIIIDSIVNKIRRLFKYSFLKNIIENELNYNYKKMIEQASKNEEILSKGLRDKIKKRYENKK